MSNDELKETLIAIGRSPETFKRDTPMLLETLDNLEEMNRRVKNIGHCPERRGLFQPGFMFKKQAE